MLRWTHIKPADDGGFALIVEDAEAPDRGARALAFDRIERRAVLDVLLRMEPPPLLRITGFKPGALDDGVFAMIVETGEGARVTLALDAGVREEIVAALQAAAVFAPPAGQA